MVRNFNERKQSFISNVSNLTKLKFKGDARQQEEVQKYVEDALN
jgi:hypothetical protein